MLIPVDIVTTSNQSILVGVNTKPPNEKSLVPLPYLLKCPFIIFALENTFHIHSTHITHQFNLIITITTTICNQ